MTLTTGDLLDRLTILALRHWHCVVDKQEAEAEGIKDEWRVTLDAFIAKTKTGEHRGLLEHIVNLTVANGAIFALESDIRNAGLYRLGHAEIGLRAEKIRDWNRYRISARNELTIAHDGPEARVEKKVRHRSE